MTAGLLEPHLSRFFLTLSRKDLEVHQTISVWTKAMILNEYGRRSEKTDYNRMSAQETKRSRRNPIRPAAG